MGKELPKSGLPKPLNEIHIRVSESHLPGNKSYKGSVVWQHTLDIEDITRQVVEKRSKYHPETLVTTFNLLKRGIYDAIEEGFNVDFSFRRTEITLDGPFGSLYGKFDPERHTLAPRLRPSPGLKQRVASLRVVNETYQLGYNSQPRPACVSLHIQPRTPDSGEPYNQPPAGEHHFISIYGDRLKLMGDGPCVGLYLHRPDNSEEHFYPPSKVLINTGKRLCFTPGFALTNDGWVAEVVTRYTSNSRPYKQPRYETLTFLVRQLPSLLYSYHT